MSFYIRFIEGDDLLNRPIDSLATLGEICLGDFKETFESSLAYWSREDYQTQWNHALNLIVGASKKSCLVTSFNDPKNSNFFVRWLLYQKDEQVVFQNQVFLLKRNRKVFDEKKLYEFIPEYRNVNPKRQKVSEWIISTKEIREYLRLVHSSSRPRNG